MIIKGHRLLKNTNFIHTVFTCESISFGQIERSVFRICEEIEQDSLTYLIIYKNEKFVREISHFLQKIKFQI